MSTLEELEARLRLVEEDRGLRTEMAALRGEMRGQMIDLRAEARATERNMERQQKLMQIVQDSHTKQLGEHTVLLNTLLENVAELRRLFIARGEK